MNYDRHNWEGLGISRQKYRMIQFRLWEDTWHTVFCAAVWFIMFMGLFVVALTSSADKRAWQFGINSKQSMTVEFHHDPTKK